MILIEYQRHVYHAVKKDTNTVCSPMCLSFSLPHDHHRSAPDHQLGRHALCTLTTAHRVQLWTQPARAMASAQHARWACVADLSALWFVAAGGACGRRVIRDGAGQVIAT